MIDPPYLAADLDRRGGRLVCFIMISTERKRGRTLMVQGFALPFSESYQTFRKLFLKIELHFCVFHGQIEHDKALRGL